MTFLTRQLAGVQNLWRHRRLVTGMAARNLKVKYKRSILGFVWTLLNPLLTVTVLVATFTYVVRIEIEDYWAFLLSGWFVWNFLGQTLSSGTHVLAEHGQLGRAVAFPKEAPILAAALSRLVEFCIELAMVLLALTIFRHGHVPVSFLILPWLIVVQFILALGLAFPIATLSVFYDDVEHAVPILVMTLFYASPVFYTATLVPEGARSFYMASPLAQVLTLFQTAVYSVRCRRPPRCSPRARSRSCSSSSVMESSIATSTFSLKSSDVAQPVTISCRGVEKRFYYYEHRTTSLRELFIRSVTRKPINVKAPLFTLTGFDLTVHRGETVALIGGNGSGKSTVLRLVAGIYKPTDGTIETHGRVAAVMELGAGFHPELTGTENVEFYASVMGLSRRELLARFDEIVDFAGVHSFIGVPIKYYSSGMQARLAFAMSVCLDPDILLIDEVMAVGDAEFRERCLNRLHELRSGGRTLLVVSHDLDTVIELCSRAVWLDKGVIRAQGPAQQVVDAYRASTG